MLATLIAMTSGAAAGLLTLILVSAFWKDKGRNN